MTLQTLASEIDTEQLQTTSPVSKPKLKKNEKASEHVTGSASTSAAKNHITADEPTEQELRALFKSYSEDTGNGQSFERFVQVSKRYDPSIMRELGQKHMRVQGVDCLP